MALVHLYHDQSRRFHAQKRRGISAASASALKHGVSDQSQVRDVACNPCHSHYFLAALESGEVQVYLFRDQNRGSD
jgi:hypothetical protein